MRTLTSAGSSRTTPTRAGATIMTGSWKSPVFSPSTSTEASNIPPSLVIASRGPRTHAVTRAGSTCTRPWALRGFTAMSPTDHSTGAGATTTATRAVCGVRRRNAVSATPIFTVSLTGADAPVTATGSVIACVSFASTLTGPNTSTVDGSAVTVPTTNPSAGSPSTVGTTGTVLLPDGSNVIDTVDGFTWTTSTPNGVRTSSPPR